MERGRRTGWQLRGRRQRLLETAVLGDERAERVGIQAREIADSASALDGLVEQSQAGNVGIGVQPPPAGGSTRDDGLVALFPGAEEVGGNAGSPGGDLNGMGGSGRLFGVG